MDDRDKERQKKIVLVLLFLLLLGGAFYFFLNQEEVTSAGLPRPNIGEVTQAQPDQGASVPQPNLTTDSLPQETQTAEATPEVIPQELPPPPQVAPPVPIGSELNPAPRKNVSAPRKVKRSTPPVSRPEKSTLSEAPIDTADLAGSWKPAPTESAEADGDDSDDGADKEESSEESEAEVETPAGLVPQPIADLENGTVKPTEAPTQDLEQSELGTSDDTLDKATDDEVEKEQDNLLAQNHVEERLSEDKPVETAETIDEGGRQAPLLADNENYNIAEKSEDDSESESAQSDSAQSEAASAASDSQEDWVGDFHADAVHLIPLIQIGQLTALPSFTALTDTVNAASNFGVGFDWNRRWSKRIQTEVSLQYLSYKYTAGTRTLTENVGGLFGGGLAASYFVKKGFDVSLRLRFSQELFYRANTVTTATLDQALLVFTGIGAGYSIFLSPKDQIRISGSVDIGLPNRINSYSINTFMNYQIRAGYETDAVGFHLGGDVGFKMDDVATSLGTQVWTGFEGRIKAGLSF